MYPKKFQALIDNLQKLPGVGTKSAERYAFQILDWSEESIEEFIKAFIDVKDKLTHCSICGNLCEDEICSICADKTRNQHIICIVQSPKDVAAMERTNEYDGLYHVLNGVISTSKGILPEDLNISSLFERINDEIDEVIIATNPTVEGETTALYLSKVLEPYGVSVTRIAHGLPMGGHLDYADELTLIKALEGRKKI